MQPEDNEQQLRNSEINILPQEQIQPHCTLKNIAILKGHDIFYQKDNQLHIRELPFSTTQYSLHNFHNARDMYEKGIARFRQSNSLVQIVTKHRKRTYSMDQNQLGAYHLYNWISTDDYPCQKASPQHKTAVIIYEILASNWEKALSLVNNLQPSLSTSTLQFLLKGFRTIGQLIKQESQYFQEQFLGRNRFPIVVKTSSDSIGGPFVYINVFEEQSKKKFREVKGLPRKVECLRLNFQYLVKFAANYKPTQTDDYIILAFKLLGNLVDQNQLWPDSEKQYIKILAHLHLRLSDRINFVTKLLPQKKRKIFCGELERTLPNFPSLEGILYYLPANSKVKQQNIDKICKAYLDHSSDLETLAYLSIQYPFLSHHRLNYTQLLILTDNQKQLDRLNHYLNESSDNLVNSIKPINPKNISFFDLINTTEEKISEPVVHREPFNVCQICSKWIQKGQHFLECGKCHHGGHPNHILKWFQESQNCSHIGCPCLCN